MSISHDDVERIIKLLNASHFDELHLETDGLKLDLRRNGATETVVRAPTATQPATAAAKQTAPAPLAAPAPAAPNVSGVGLHEIKAPMLGTFYGSPKPGAEPFMRVGSRVDSDTVIGIIEVMKLMNSVSAGVRGEIVEVVAQDGSLVEYDQVLVRVRPL